MPLWTKNGAGSKPKHLSAEESKKVIATPTGWVKREQYTSHDGKPRLKDELLVASSGLSSEDTMGNPDIAEIYVANSTGGSALKRNSLNSVNVVFTEPISIGASASPLRLNVANTAGGNTVIATSSTDKSLIVNANNTLVFKFSVATAGTYAVNPQNLANTAQAKVYGVYGGASELVDTNISAAVSAALGTFKVS